MSALFCIWLRQVELIDVTQSTLQSAHQQPPAEPMNWMLPTLHPLNSSPEDAWLADPQTRGRAGCGNMPVSQEIQAAVGRDARI